MTCAICHTRKPRRACPAIHGDICTICCGTGREQTIDCPLDCVYLREAHEHEAPADLETAAIPNLEIEVTEDFLVQNEILLAFLAITVFEAAIESRELTDWDVREALESLIQTYRSLKNGIYYEARPANIYAARIAANVQSKLEEVKDKETTATGATSLRDSAILTVLAFLQRLEYTHNNGRRKSRAFIDFLRGFATPAEGDSVESPNAAGLELPASGIIL